jgi:hypothetical protein
MNSVYLHHIAQPKHYIVSKHGPINKIFEELNCMHLSRSPLTDMTQYFPLGQGDFILTFNV